MLVRRKQDIFLAVEQCSSRPALSNVHLLRWNYNEKSILKGLTCVLHSYGVLSQFHKHAINPLDINYIMHGGTIYEISNRKGH